MDLRLTITRDGDDRATDVTVVASSGHTAADLLRELLASLGGSGTALTSGGRSVADDHPVGRPPLVDGASLTVGDPADPPVPSSTPRAGLVLDVVAGPDCGQSLALSPGRHTIGRGPDCSLVIADPAMSRRHATVEVSSDGVRVTDHGSTNPIRILGAGPIGRPLAPNDELLVGHTRLRARATATRPLATTPAGDGTVVVHRSPHLPGAPVGARLELPRRPMPPVPPRVQWVALLLPIPVCALLALLWGPQLLAFALLGPIVGAGSTLVERRTSRHRYAAELAAHAAACAAVRTCADQALAADVASRHRAHPDPAELARTARETGHRLWERRAEAAPVVLIGRGPVVSRVVVVDPDAPEADKPLVLPDGPVAVDLSQTSVLGVVGPRRRVEAVARCLLVQLAVLHSPDDLALRVVTGAGRPVGTPGDPVDPWAWHRWLPHAGASSRSGPVATTHRPVEAAGEHPAYPWTVTLILDGSAGQESVAALRAGAAGDRHAVIVVADRADDLPAECCAILDLGTDPSGAVLSLPRLDPCDGLVADGASVAWAERIARRLAPLRDAGRDRSRLPTTVTFADTHPDLTGPGAADALATRWAAPPGGLRCVLGVGADGPLVVDVVGDGPHALVGGTTGAGKSELLRAMVTGLAAAYPPDAVTFLLIDYKGGAAFRECAHLPHTVGVVTDLDADLARRALVSLTAEVRRREALLAEVGASSLADHDRLRRPGGERVPRLVIVVDEFKMLIEELPEFVEGVVRLAAVGRSLGIHLVLATQRPAGAITADIQANVNLRIALRVRDRQDSEGVIEAPDAALLPVSVPGRALLSTGSGALVAFQTAHLGAAPSSEMAPLRVHIGLGPPPVGAAAADNAGSAEGWSDDSASTDLGLFVELAREVAVRGRHLPPRRPWLPELPTVISVDDLIRRGGIQPGGGSGVPIGLLDLPERQAQPPWTWAPGGPQTVGVVGSAGSGRSSLVRTLVAGLQGLAAPTHAYVVDGGGVLGPLAGLPWVGAVVPDTDRVRLRRLVERLRQDVERRTKDLAARGLTTLGEWQRSGPGDAPPYLLLVIDGWDALAEPAGGLGTDLDGLSLAEELRALIGSSGAAGLHAVLTGGRGLLLGRGARLCSETIVLGRLDPTDATLAGLTRRDVVTHPALPGRGVRIADGAGIQVGHLGADPSGAAQSTALIGRARAARHGACVPADAAPFTVGALPDRVMASDLPPGSPFIVGLDADGLPSGFDPDLDGRRLLVAGARRAGRTTTLLTIAGRCVSAGRPAVLVSRSGMTAPVAGRTVGGFWTVGPADVSTLVALRREHPHLVVLVDDADQLGGSAVEPVLSEIVGLLDRDGGVVVAAVEPHALARLIRGPAVDVASRRTGLLLSPAGSTDGDAFGVRVPKAGGPPRPGRGHLVARGVVTDIQVAITEERRPADVVAGHEAAAWTGTPEGGGP